MEKQIQKRIWKLLLIFVIFIALIFGYVLCVYGAETNMDYYQTIEKYENEQYSYATCFAKGKDAYNNYYTSQEIYWKVYYNKNYRACFYFKDGALMFLTSGDAFHFITRPKYSVDGVWLDKGNETIGSFISNFNNAYYVDTLTTSHYVFNDYESAQKYVNAGLVDNVFQEPRKTYNADELYINTLDIQFFDSNSYDESYIEFYYTCDDSLVGCNIEFDYTYTYACSTITNSDGYGKTGTEHISYTIDNTRGTIRVYIKNLQCIKDCLSSVWFNSEPISKRNVMGYGGNFYIDSLLYKVNNSNLDIIANIVNGNSYGEQYVFSVNLINGKADKYTNTPSDDGEYTYNNDYQANTGHYSIEIDKDNFGNTTYNYYYYDYSTNEKTVVTNNPSDDKDDEPSEDGGGSSSSTTNVDGNTITNTNNNNPTFNNNVNVTVEGDKINNDIDNIVDNTLNNEDNKGFLDKFMSMFGLLENNAFLKVYGVMFGWLPSECQLVISSALTICIGIGVYKLFKR